MKLDALARPRPRAHPAPPILSWFEFAPSWLIYAPVVAQWIALGLRYGDMSLPTAANPRIETGGLAGESKSAILDQVAGAERDLVAPYVVLENRHSDAAAAMARGDLTFPVVAKPDIGCNGSGVRLIRDAHALAQYLAQFPDGLRVVLQEFVPLEGEAGVFYVREPGVARGRITSITLKRAPVVTGDGRSTLEALVRAHPRAGRVPHLYLPRLSARLAEVPAAGARVPLVFVGNHCRGSEFEDGRAHATEALAARIDRFARAMPDFHFGRIDLRFDSIALLRRGEGFRIIEVNGAGSEATHIWDPATRLVAAWRDQLHHYGLAWRIGAANRAAGHRPSGLVAMHRAWRLQRRVMRSHPQSD
jgi:hypothetical protein